MANCNYCEKKVSLPFRCKFCSKEFCSEHRLPENHDCKGLEEYVAKSESLTYEPLRRKVRFRVKRKRKNLWNYLPENKNTLILISILIFSSIGFLSIYGILTQNIFDEFALKPSEVLNRPGP